MFCTWLPGLPDFMPHMTIYFGDTLKIRRYHFYHQAKEELKIGSINYDRYV